jgi:hypothetical protein
MINKIYYYDGDLSDAPRTNADVRIDCRDGNISAELKMAWAREDKINHMVLTNLFTYNAPVNTMYIYDFDTKQYTMCDANTRLKPNPGNIDIGVVCQLLQLGWADLVNQYSHKHKEYKAG